MCDTFINWYAFSWEAFATLATGFAAVFAAYQLGRRQVVIQETQAKLQELTLRSELFDRRYRIYERVKLNIDKLLAHAKPLEWTECSDLSRANLEASFLFDSETCTKIDEIVNRVFEFRKLNDEMQQTFQNSGHYGDGNPRLQSEQLKWFANRVGTLNLLFHQLKLS